MNRRKFLKSTAIVATGLTANTMISATTDTAKDKQRTVYKVINPTASSMGSLKLTNVVHDAYQNYVSPFFLVDEFGPMQLPKGAPFRVDAHPHAGIIPTTYLFEGNAHHRDSMNNDFQYHEGDFIHFTSGKGALHMEETGDVLYENGGTFHGMQGWLNMPPHLKKIEPVSHHLSKNNIPVVEKDGAYVRLILGEAFGKKSPLHLAMPVIYWHVSIKANGSITLPIDQHFNAFIYLLQGSIEINGSNQVAAKQTVLFERDGNAITVKALQAADFLVLGGEVNNAPYTAAGPFVLNNEQEINQAYTDFQTGKFGDLTQTNGTRRS